MFDKCGSGTAVSPHDDAVRMFGKCSFCGGSETSWDEDAYIAHELDQADGEETTRLVSELAALQQALAGLTERIDYLKDVLRKLGPGQHAAGDHTVTVTPFRRLDETKVREQFDPTVYPLLYKRVVDGPKLKATVPTQTYESLMSESGKARVSIK